MAPIQWTQRLQKLWSDYLKTNQPTHRAPKTEQLNWIEKVGGKDVQQNATVTTYELSENGQTMRYTVDIIGNGPQPADGYPLYIGLHGGGGAGSVAEFKSWSQTDQDSRRQSNDGAWYMMSHDWYIKGIQAKGTPAIYIAPRGITDTWDLGFQPETYILIQRLIRNLLLKQPMEAGTGLTIAPTFINANRVYLLGFSAGGDAVYRQSTKISDCFGAVNMSGGHPGEVKLWNLANLPICLQVGENDNEQDLKRMALTAKTSIELLTYATAMKKIEQSKPYYIHDCFIHPGQGHSAWNEDPNNPWSQDYGDNDINIVARDQDSLEKWYTRNKNGVDPHNGTLNTYDEHVNTSAITWVSRHVRDPVRPYIIWHLGSRPPRPEPFNHVVASWEPKRYFYWLMITKDDAEKSFGDNEIIHASYDRNDNAVWIRRTPIKLTILLNDSMLKLGQDVKIFYGPAKTALQPIRVNESVQIQKMTLDARGDPNLVFSAAISFDTSTNKAIDSLFSEQIVKSVL